LLCAASVGEQLLSDDREEVEVRQPERGRHHKAEHRGDDYAGAERSVPRSDANGDKDSPIAMMTISP
jgi:hypothetical protein